MKMQNSFLCALLSLPMLTLAKEGAILLRQALTSKEPVSLAFTKPSDGMKVDIEDPSPAHLYQARVVRKLQFTDACNASYIELWENEALNETYTTYATNYDEATAAAFSNCVDDGADTLTCTVEGPIEGETEFQSACTAAGGETLPIGFDLSCDATLDGQTTTLVADTPSLLTCVPASSDFDSCADSLDEIFKNVTDLMALFVEFGLTFEGFSDVSCSVGEIGGEDDGGSSNAAAHGIGFAFMIAMICLSLLFPYH